MNQSSPKYDVVIVGGGPAGLSAALYAARDKRSVLIIEKGIIGGLITETEKIDNYPGFPEGLSGFDLTDKMYKQVQKYGTKDVSAEVKGIEQQGREFLVKTTESDYIARALIVASGSSHMKLNVPGEKEYTGKGVAYCATCDAPFYTDKIVAVAGGGDTALYEALHLTKFAKKVYLIHRRSEYRASPTVQEYVLKNGKIEPVLNTVIEGVEGGDFVERLSIKNVVNSETSKLDVDGIFIAVGLKPNTEFLGDLVKLDAGGTVIVNDRMETSMHGVLAAGDVRSSSIRQTVAACGDGAVAAVSAGKWLGEA